MRRAAFAAAIAAALALAGSALADQWQVHRTAAGNAAARAAVVSRADLGSASGWTGGSTKPDLTSTPPCGNFAPKQSDLVVVGAAASAWRHQGLELQSQANVLQTAAMVRTDWQRSIVDPRATTCLRTTLLKELGAGAKLVRFGVAAFPRVAPLVRAYRGVVTVSGTKVIVDVVAIGKGRTEIELTTAAPLAADAVIRIAERRLAEKLVARVRA
jgi:hypothetical protein